MVSSCVAVPTVGTRVSQCGLMTTMARGVPSWATTSRRAAPAAPACKANIGEPWGTKRTGRSGFMGMDCRRQTGFEKPSNHNIFVAQSATMDKLVLFRSFVRVAEAGSFIAVAHQLQVARSVVTRQVAALEKHLGTKLITRSTRSLTLTAAGSAYLEKCRLILNMVDAAESSLAEEKSVPRGRIRLGLPLTYGLQELMPALLDFAQAQPFIELSMDLSDQRANLVEEGLDLSVRITADVQPGDIVRKLGECQLLTLASPAYLAQHGEPRHPSDLRQHECLIYASDTAVSTWPYRDKGQTLQVPVRGRIVANNGAALTEAAA